MENPKIAISTLLILAFFSLYHCATLFSHLHFHKITFLQSLKRVFIRKVNKNSKTASKILLLQYSM